MVGSQEHCTVISDAASRHTTKRCCTQCGDIWQSGSQEWASPGDAGRRCKVNVHTFIGPRRRPRFPVVLPMLAVEPEKLPAYLRLAVLGTEITGITTVTDHCGAPSPSTSGENSPCRHPDARLSPASSAVTGRPEQEAETLPSPPQWLLLVSGEGGSTVTVAETLDLAGEVVERDQRWTHALCRITEA